MTRELTDTLIMKATGNMMVCIPLVTFWEELAFGEAGRPPAPVARGRTAENDPAFLEEFRIYSEQIADRETKAWRQICAAASKGWIEIRAKKRIGPTVADQKWYSRDGLSALEEIVPKDTFERNVKIGPLKPSVLYFDGEENNIFNAPYWEPFVYLTEQRRSTLAAQAGTSNRRHDALSTLISMRQSGSQPKPRSEIQNDLIRQFGIGIGQAQLIWNEAADSVPRDDWGRPGRPKKSNN